MKDKKNNITLSEWAKAIIGIVAFFGLATFLATIGPIVAVIIAIFIGVIIFLLGLLLTDPINAFIVSISMTVLLGVAGVFIISLLTTIEADDGEVFSELKKKIKQKRHRKKLIEEERIKGDDLSNGSSK